MLQYLRALVAVVMLGMLPGFAQEAFPPPGFQVVGPRDWSVIAPFACPAAGKAEENLAKSYPPEEIREFTAQYPGADGTLICWTAADAGSAAVSVLPKKERPPAWVIGYAVTYLQAPTARQVKLAFTADAPVKLWVNGKPVKEWLPPAAGAAAVPGEVTAEITAGLNEILLKINPYDTNGNFRLALSGGTDLKFFPERPWPFLTIPVATWRLLPTVTPAESESLRQKDAIGLPVLPGPDRAWQVPAVAADRIQIPAAPDGTRRLLAGHLFAPLKYHSQPYFFRFSCELPADFYIDGQKLAGTWDQQHVFIGSMPASQMRTGLNRLVLDIPAGAATSCKLEITSPGDVKFLADVPPAMDPKNQVGNWPSATITNGLITAQVAVPDLEKGYYRGNRFEQAGIVTKLEFAGHRFFLPAAEPNTPLDSSVCSGTAEECFDAIAWNDAKPGEPFIKFGVGLYEKPFSPQHRWYCAYWPVSFFPWQTTAAKDRIEFVQAVTGPRDWGYHYRKLLVLDPKQPILRIEHELTNTGKQTIDTEQYNHNFFQIDDIPNGKGYAIAFPYVPKSEKDISKIGEFQGNRLVVTAEKPSGMVHVSGWAAEAKDSSFIVSHEKVPIAVRISGDFPMAKLGIYFSPDYVAPEPFYKISLAPGATVKWTRTYEFLTDAAVGK